MDLLKSKEKPIGGRGIMFAQKYDLKKDKTKVFTHHEVIEHIPEKVVLVTKQV